MNYAYNMYGDGRVHSTPLPNGGEFAYAVGYTVRETAGVIALQVISGISLLAVLGLLVAIAVSAFATRQAPQGTSLFVRTHVATYFVSMLVCDGLQSIGSLMSVRWVSEQMVQFDSFCVVQGIIKQAADVGTATWSLAVAVHTFNVLFLGVTVPRYVMWTTLVGGWTFIAAIVLTGPAVFDTVARGPFFAISGMWCWISPQFPAQRIVLDYLQMFLSAFFCFVLYTLIFLRLRGNITRSGRGAWAFSRTAAPAAAGLAGEQFGRAVARRMIWYPVVYTVLLLPIALARFLDWAGAPVPFEATLACDALFLCSGAANVSMFAATRSLLPRCVPSVVSRPVLQSATTETAGSRWSTSEVPFDEKFTA